MVSETHFLRMICDQPDDDDPRLVYADWLEEAVRVGEGTNAARAEFIRVQIELNKQRTTVPAPCRCCSRGGSKVGNCRSCRAVSKLVRREKTLLADHGQEWAWTAFGKTWEFGQADGQFVAFVPCHSEENSRVFWVRFRRGFVWRVDLTAERFVGLCWRCLGTGLHDNSVRCNFPCGICKGSGEGEGLAGRLFASAPIRRVVLTDKTPTMFGSMKYWESRRFGLTSGPTELPRSIYDYLEGGRVIDTDLARGREYSSDESAYSDLNSACVRLGINKAKLLTTAALQEAG